MIVRVLETPAANAGFPYTFVVVDDGGEPWFFNHSAAPITDIRRAQGYKHLNDPSHYSENSYIEVPLDRLDLLPVDLAERIGYFSPHAMDCGPDEGC